MRTVHTLHLDDSVEITNDLECGNADLIRPVGPNHVEIGPRDDGVPHDLQVKGPLSCYNVCVLLRNDAPEALSLTIDVVIPPWLLEPGFAKFLRNVYFERDPDDVRYTQLPPGEDLGGRMRFALELPARAARVFSSVPHLPYSTCVRRLQELSCRPGVALRQTGESALGRPVHALELGPPDGRPRVVVTGTLQAGEPSAWAVLAMAEWLLDTEEGRHHLEAFRIDLVPMPNPDGNVLGRCNVNGEGVLAVLQFAEVAAGKPCTVETQIAWDYLAQDPPLGTIEFHIHRLANHPSCTMGFPDATLYNDPTRAALTDAVAQRMGTLDEHGRVHRWGVDDAFWSRFCVYHAARRLNVVTCVDQYTGPGASLEGSVRRAPAVLAAFLEGLSACG